MCQDTKAHPLRAKKGKSGRILFGFAFHGQKSIVFVSASVYNKLNALVEVNKVLAIGSDHAGFYLKKALEKELDDQKIAYRDFGTLDGTSVDYPGIAAQVSCAVAQGECERGILVCGTGIGMSICANKVHGIRASLCHDVFSARMTRMHNDSNILCMGERVIGQGLAVDVMNAWLHTDFEGGRHQRRVDMISAVENETDCC